MSLGLPELRQLLAKTDAEKLARTRKRRAKEFVRNCEVLRDLDRKLITSLRDCSPAVREQIRADLAAQEDLMLDALTQPGPSATASLTSPKSPR